MTLSLVIPAYNEEDYIGPCLGSVLAQEELPDEIIVVDNNCHDRTVEITERFPGVRIVREARQGIAYFIEYPIRFMKTCVHHRRHVKTKRSLEQWQ